MVGGGRQNQEGVTQSGEAVMHSDPPTGCHGGATGTRTCQQSLS